MNLLSETQAQISRFQGMYGHPPSHVFIGRKQADIIREYLNQFGVKAEQWQCSEETLCGMKLFKVNHPDLLKVAE